MFLMLRNYFKYVEESCINTIKSKGATLESENVSEMNYLKGELR